MGKATGFLEYTREEEAVVSEKERIQSFDEFHLPLSEEERKEQGGRCMNCGVPLCQSAISLKGMVTGCPLHNLIPEWNDEIWRGHGPQALRRLLKTNSFPEFTGRVCPALCEKACINGRDGDPVTIRENEKYIIEEAFASGYMKPHRPKHLSGKRVAVVGSGPAGLAAADRLCHRGHEVAVFEREDEIGGLLMYGIPNMKLDKSVILRRKKLMEEEGVVFHTGVNVGKDRKAKTLLDDFDAVVLCTGAKEPRKLACVKKLPEGAFYAVDFLTEVTRTLRTGKEREAFSYVKGQDVVVLGGGDTGNDCVGTAIRLGAGSVTQLEMMPEPPRLRQESNPWPEWPKVKKTDYGQEEAISLFGYDPRIYETTIKELILKDGKLSAVKTVRVTMTKKGPEEVSGTEQIIPCSLLLIAAGFIGCERYTADAFGIGCDDRGRVQTEPGAFQTQVEKVFTAGDMHRGQSLVVWAIAEGRACARAVDEYLMSYTELDTPL